MRITVLFLSLIVFSITPLAAQESSTLPDDLQPITPENAVQLQELASVGGLLPGELTWLSEEKILIADTSPVPRPPVIFTNGIRIEISDEKGEIPVELYKMGDHNVEVRLGSNYDLNRIVLSPDNQYAALAVTTNSNLVVQLWDIQRASLVMDFPQQFELLDTLAYHNNGKLLVIGTTTNAPYGNTFEDVQIWDGRIGIQMHLHPGYLPVRFSPDGSLMAFMTGDGIALWTDRELGILHFDPYAESELPSLRFSPDGKTIATTSGHNVLLWDANIAQLPTSPRQTLSTEARVTDILYSPDGSQLAAVEEMPSSPETGDLGVIELWDAQTGEPYKRFGAANYVYDAAFSPDGRLLGAYAFGGNRLLWNVQTGDNTLTLPYDAVLNADWSRAAYWDHGIVRIIDTTTGQETELTAIEDYLGDIAAFSPTAERVVFTGTELRMVDLRSGEPVFSEPLGESAPWVQFSANGERFVTGMDSSQGDPVTLQIRDTQHPQQPLTQLEIPFPGKLRLLSPDSTYLSQLYAACGGGMLRLWDIETGEALVAVPNEGACTPSAQQIFSPDGQWLIINLDSGVTIFDVAALIEEAAATDAPFLEAVETAGRIYYPNAQIEQVTVSPDGSRIAVSLAVRPLDAVEPTTTYRVDVYAFSDVIRIADNQALRETAVSIPDTRQVFFSPDGQWLVTDTGFWNAAAGEQRAEVSGQAAAFSPDGHVLAAITTGETITAGDIALWDVSEVLQGNRSPLAHLHTHEAQELVFSLDGTLLYVRRAGDIQVWGIPVAVP